MSLHIFICTDVCFSIIYIVNRSCSTFKFEFNSKGFEIIKRIWKKNPFPIGFWAETQATGQPCFHPRAAHSQPCKPHPAFPDQPDPVKVNPAEVNPKPNSVLAQANWIHTLLIFFLIFVR
jgi:hypothetical protein